MWNTRGVRSPENALGALEVLLQRRSSLGGLECCLAGPRQLGFGMQVAVVGVTIEVGEGQELLESCGAGGPPTHMLV